MDTLTRKIEMIVEKKGICLLAIDGCGGSGKSTLAQFLVTKFGAGQIIHMDDFYKTSEELLELTDERVGGTYDLDRFRHQVMKPILQGVKGAYQRYDWVLDVLVGSHEVVPHGLIVIEGCYCLHEALRDFYDLKVFVETDREIRLRRGLQRDGQEALQAWEKWMKAEDVYLDQQDPKDSADFVVSGEIEYEGMR